MKAPNDLPVIWSAEGVIARAVRALEIVTELGGRWSAWLAAVLVAVTGLVVLLRYGFSIGSIQLQESIIYINAAMVVLGAGYTLKHNGHVRVDVVYGRLSDRGKAMVNIGGSLLLLLPSMVYVLWVSWDYVAVSWQIRERSAESGGLPYVYLLKSGILVLCGLLIWQAVAELLKDLTRLVRKP